MLMMTLGSSDRRWGIRPLCQLLLGKLPSLETEVCTEGVRPSGGNAAERTKWCEKNVCNVLGQREAQCWLPCDEVGLHPPMGNKEKLTVGSEGCCRGQYVRQTRELGTDRGVKDWRPLYNSPHFLIWSKRAAGGDFCTAAQCLWRCLSDIAWRKNTPTHDCEIERHGETTAVSLPSVM